MALTKITGEGVGAVDDVTIEGHASVGVNAVDATRALTVAGSTDDSSASGLVVYNSSLASKFSVRNDGYITAAGDIQVGGSLYVGGTAAANALDDYEEGTFTPVISPSSGSFTTTSGSGYYTKIGNQVFVFGYMKIDNIGTGSGGLGFVGLPFATSNRSFPAGNRGGLLFIREDQRTGDTMHGFISAGQTYGVIQDHDGLNFSFSNNDTFVFDGVYHTG